MQEKFIKNTIYAIIAILLLIMILIQPYNLYCKITGSCFPVTFSSIGFNRAGDKYLNINFAAQINDEAKNIVEFYPKEKAIKIRSGKTIHNFYLAKNLSNKPVIIKTKMKLEPFWVNQYLERIECLCFKNQPLNAKEEKSLPVSFRIKPEIEEDKNFTNLKEISVSYEVYF
jgi:cytochrome c oxidase assembly protein subunit 11